MGFKSNPDDLCVMKKDIEGDQFTINLHVDDLKLSFAREDEIKIVLNDLEDEYVKLDIQRGKKLQYLGLTIDFETEGVVSVSATLHIDRALKLYGGDIKLGAKTHAAEGLFNVDKESVPLEEEKRTIFHSVFATLLWVGTVARPDILVALSYLGKRTTNATTAADDDSKLERLLLNVRVTRYMPLT